MAVTKKKSQRAAGRTPAAGPIRKVPDLRDLLGDAPEVFVQFGLEHVVEYLRQYVKQGPKFWPPLASRVALLGRVAKKTDPKAALDLSEKALSLSADCPEALLLAAQMQDALGRQKESVALVLRLTQADKATPDQLLAAANMLVRFDHQSLALRVGREAFEAMGSPLRAVAGLIYIAQRAADWTLLKELTTQCQRAYAAGLSHEVIEEPRDHLLWCADQATNILVTTMWSERVVPLAPALCAPPVSPLTGRRLRLGYLSSDFRQHPTASLVNGLLRHHDHERFELFMYCSGWNDGSALRKEIERHFEHIHSVGTLDDEAAAQLIASHGIDVLVELNGPTRAHRMAILGHRPAPVQIDYLGFPGSVGGRVVDYVVGDDYTVPAEYEALYPEKLILIPHSYQVNDYAARAPIPILTRSQMDLPEGDALILGMFNAVDKVHREVWQVWMRILHAVPNAMLWTLNHGLTALQHLAGAAADEGIDPNRIIIAPKMAQDEHLTRMQGCDLMLDPWPYGGHTTTSDALYACVPVISLEGKNFAGRVSGGLLRAAGLESLVVPDQDAYVEKAIALLRNPAELADLKRHLRDTVMQSPVFDAVSRTRHLEEAYLRAYETAEKGEAPATIRISESAQARPVPVYARAPAPALNTLDQKASKDAMTGPAKLMNQLEVCIISWQGQHENARFIADQIQSVAHKVQIVYSDPDPDFSLEVQCTQLKRPNALFWGDKFKACMDTFSGGLLMVIHADCTCDDWLGLLNKCLYAFENHQEVAVWAPRIDGTPYDVRVATVGQINQTSLNIVTNTDGIVFCLSRQVVERMKRADLSENKYGWGIDIMFSAYTLTIGKLAVVDHSVFVKHSSLTGYLKQEAHAQLNLFLQQLSTPERVQYHLSEAYMNVRRHALREAEKFKFD